MTDKEDATEQQDTANQVDGPAFLSHLRAAGAFKNESNEETIGRGNTSAHTQNAQSLESLTDMFSPSDKPRNDNNTEEKILATEKRPSLLHGKTHLRGVSWGKNSTEYIEDDDMSSLGGGSRRRLTSTELFSESRNGPFVEEAELHILRSLEQQNSVSNLDIESPSFLSQVPENAAHDFSTSDEPKRRTYSEDKPRTPSSGEETRPLVRHQDEKPNHHRRTMTVEDTLAGLTNAMSALHFQGHLRTSNSSDSEESGNQLNQNTAADNLANNAHRILQDDDREEIRRKARGYWSLLLNNLPALREETEEATQIERTDSGSRSDDDAHYDSSRGDGVDLEAQEKHNTKSSNNTKGGRKRNKKKRGSVIANRASDKLKDDIEIWRSFFRPRQETVWTYVKYVLFYLILPLVGVSAILFYIGNNPIQGKSEDGLPGDKPSISWWLLFVVRQVVTLSLALAMQGLVIDFLALGTKIILRLVGPIVTLLIVQAKGWPFICFWWSIFDFAMLAGPSQFAHHWLFWQDIFGLCNNENPSGLVVESEVYLTILTIVVSVSVLVAVKRFVVGIYLGRQTFSKYLVAKGTSIWFR